MNLTYYNPVRTITGAGSLRHLDALIRSLSAAGDHILVLAWDPCVYDNDVFAGLEKNHPDRIFRRRIFSASNPTVNQLLHIYKETRDFAPSLILAAGGGSVMDIGKSLCCLYGRNIENADDIRNLIAEGGDVRPASAWIGIPTTSGTGSEVTCWATIWDPEQGKKRSLENHRNFAAAAIADPVMTKDLPLPLSVSTALDAVSHAAESCWAKSSNPVSQALALYAIRTIMQNMDDLTAGKGSAREAMARGSMIAGLAFSNTKTTACHSISYPLTLRYGIPHGTAVSMLLSPVLALNKDSIKDPSPLLQALGVRSADQLGDKIRSYLTRSGQAASLSGWGVPAADLPLLAGQGITKGRADNNPVPLTQKIIETILRSVF